MFKKKKESENIKLLKALNNKIDEMRFFLKKLQEEGKQIKSSPQKTARRSYPVALKNGSIKKFHPEAREYWAKQLIDKNMTADEITLHLCLPNNNTIFRWVRTYKETMGNPKNVQQ